MARSCCLMEPSLEGNTGVGKLLGERSEELKYEAEAERPEEERGKPPRLY